MQSWVEWARGQGTDSPAIPLPKTITASTTSSHNNLNYPTKTLKRLTREDGKTKQGGNTWVFPPPLILWNHALFISTLHCHSWLWFILFDVRVYMMPTIMCQIARYTIGNYPYCQNIHNQIDGGGFAFSSSPRLITLYTSCKQGRNRDVTFPSPLE